MPAVTILTPTFNRHGPLLEAIRSVQAQVFTRYQHLIIADGHDPEVERIVKECQDPRIVYTHTDKPHGDWGAAARNHGLRMASAPLLCCLDDDNLLKPEYLFVMVNSFTPELGFVVCWIDHPSIRVAATGVLKPELPPKVGTIDQLCTMFRTDLVRQVGGWIPGYECDFTLVDAVSKISQGVVVRRSLAQYRMLPGHKLFREAQERGKKSKNPKRGK